MLSSEQKALWIHHIKQNILDAIKGNIQEEQWDSAIKGLRFVREIENLILTSEEKSE
jgi:hypothetical protein